MSATRRRARRRWSNSMVSQSSDGTGKTVLVVEDSAMSREKISSILQELGCAVIPAADGMEALKAVKEQGADIDLVVLDIQMPRMDGITALRYMRKIPGFADCPIVMLTTQVDTETVRTALTHKANDFIRKDASIPRITERLQSHLQAEKRGSGAAAQQQAPNPELAERIVQGCRKYHPRKKGPYILCYEASPDLQAIGQAKDGELMQFYQRILGALEEFNQTYPGLELGYSIEHDTKEVNRLVRAEDQQVELVMISARRQDGFSLARMMAFGITDGPPVLLICDDLAALSMEQRDNVIKMGVQLLERGELDADALEKLIGKHLVPRVQMTDSGLKYLELVSGSGDPPNAGQQVTVHYTGMLENGTVFDDSNKGGEPFQFALGEGIVIDGWEEGISMMKQGGRAMLVIPPDLGYGEEGDGGAVPPNATLVFHVELVAVDKPSEEDPLV